MPILAYYLALTAIIVAMYCNTQKENYFFLGMLPPPQEAIPDKLQVYAVITLYVNNIEGCIGFRVAFLSSTYGIILFV